MLMISFVNPQEATDKMSSKFSLINYNSRKHISISIPSSTEAMSPHIKSIEELRVLGVNLSSFNTPTQFFICVTGVFLFYLIYGYLQVQISVLSPTLIWISPIWHVESRKDSPPVYILLLQILSRYCCLFC